MNKLTLISLAGLLGLSSAAAQSADYTLRFSHFWPASSGVHQGFEAWGKSLEAASDGRVKVDFYPAQTLTKAPQSYDGVKHRIADITATVQGYTANRFPLTQIMELPGMADTAVHGTCVLQSLYDEGLISGEYQDTQVLYLFTHGPGYLHTRDKVIEKPEDLAGLKIRRPTTVVAQLLESQGAQPVGMPAPETYPSLQRGVIDGVAMPWEAMKVFRLNEQAGQHAEINLYTLSFVVTMNKQVYNGMPEDLKAVIQSHSGMEWAQKQARVFDGLDRAGYEEATSANHQINTLQQSAWQAVFEQATERYLAELEARQLPARDVYRRARELSASCAS